MKIAALIAVVPFAHSCTFDASGISGTDGALVTPDGSGDDSSGASVDGAITIDATPCVLGAFTSPVAIPELNTVGVDQATWLTRDELTVYFNSDRPGGQGDRDIWQATRGSIADPWQNLVNVTEINSTGSERHPAIRDDGLEIFWSTDRAGTLGGQDLWSATRTNTSSPFGTATNLSQLNSSDIDFFPTISRDALTLYFSSRRFGVDNNDYDIFVATRTDVSSPFGSPELINELTTNAGEAGIAISDDELTAYVQSNRAGGEGWDIWIATRPDKASQFSSLTLVPGVNSAGTDYARWLSPDGQRLYITISGSGPAWNNYVSTRPCN